MEMSLTQVVREFEKERKHLRTVAKQQLDEVKALLSDLSIRLAKKTVEMRRIKRLSQHILDQRTEMEEFFMESLEFVKEQIRKERQQELKHTQERYKQSMKAVSPI